MHQLATKRTEKTEKKRNRTHKNPSALVAPAFSNAFSSALASALKYFSSTKLRMSSLYGEKYKPTAIATKVLRIRRAISVGVRELLDEEEDGMLAMCVGLGDCGEDWGLVIGVIGF